MQSQNRGPAPQSSPSSPLEPSRKKRTAGLPTQCFSVQAQAEPGTLPRVLEVFAKRGLVPAQVHSALAPSPKEDLIVDVHLADTDAEAARLIAQELRRQFCVDAVLVAEKSAPAGI